MIHDTYLFGVSSNRKTPWTPADIAAVFKQAAAASSKIRELPSAEIIAVLDAAGKLFTKGGRYYKKAFDHLCQTVPFSKEAIEATLAIIPTILAKAELEKRLRLELGLEGMMDRCPVRYGYDGFLTAAPKGVVLHVGAGNVFLGVVDSLVMGLLTKNVNVVKTATNGSAFAVLFAQALKEADEKGIVSGSVAILSWPGGSTDIEEKATSLSDIVLVWGGAAAQEAYKKIAPASVTVLGFGPKVSMGVVTEKNLLGRGLEYSAGRVARDVGTWDQAACASPHTLYIISPEMKKSPTLQKEYLQKITEAFNAFAKKMPQGRLSPDEQVEITKARELAKIDRASGTAQSASSFPATSWTVIFEDDPAFRVSPLNRVLYIKCVEKPEEVLKQMMPFKGYIQTVGIAGSLRERQRLGRLFAKAGIARVTRLGDMLEAPAGSPHDGMFPLSRLVNIIGIEGRPSQSDKLSEIVEFARNKSPFYKKHYRGAKQVYSIEDFRTLPLLDKNHILANTPPESYEMFTGPLTGGVYFASGGSTGSPKYIFYDSQEYGNVCRALGFAMASAGLGPEDRAANLFVSGNLWSSWLSVEKALSRTKAVSIPLGSALPMETILHYLHEFQVTAIIGLPSFLLKVAEAVYESKGKYSFPLRYIFYGGEYVGPAMAKYFKSVFPGVHIHSAGYATVDAGVLGFQCPHCKNGVHHLMKEDQFLEILDPDTMEPVEDGEVGELVTTVLNKRHMPIIRFRLGDLGRWLPPCPCGRQQPLFEILGRCDDRIHVGGAHLFVNDLQTAIEEVPGLSFNFQVEITTREHREVLIIRVETNADGHTPAQMKKFSEQLMKAIRRNCDDLVYVLDHEWMHPPEIAILPPGAIPRVQRTGKIKKVLDKRIQL